MAVARSRRARPGSRHLPRLSRRTTRRSTRCAASRKNSPSTIRRRSCSSTARRPGQKAHIVGGFRFELSKVAIPAIRERMVSSLRNVSEELAVAVADGLGIELPSPMPRAIETVPAAEVMSSPALSLFALPGDGGIATRKIAILVANGIEGESVSEVMDALTDAGAVVRLLGTRLGTVTSDSGETFEVDATLENSPAVAVRCAGAARRQ